MVDLLMKHIVAGTKVSQHLTHLGNDSIFFIIYKYFGSELYTLDLRNLRKVYAIVFQLVISLPK